MTTLTQVQIKEIAEQLDCGFFCYYNKSNSDLLFIPDLDHHPDMELDAWKDDFKKIEKDRDNYVVIEPPTSSQAFNMMAAFVDAIPDGNHLKTVLTRALEKKKPFREFKFALDNSGEFRQNWFDFKNEKLQQWVKDELAIVTTIKS